MSNYILDNTDDAMKPERVTVYALITKHSFLCSVWSYIYTFTPL